MSKAFSSNTQRPMAVAGKVTSKTTARDSSRERNTGAGAMKPGNTAQFDPPPALNSDRTISSIRQDHA